MIMCLWGSYSYSFFFHPWFMLRMVSSQVRHRIFWTTSNRCCSMRQRTSSRRSCLASKIFHKNWLSIKVATAIQPFIFVINHENLHEATGPAPATPASAFQMGLRRLRPTSQAAVWDK